MSIQNEFSLIARSFESHLAEACAPSNWNLGLLAWTPLAGGQLTGKYNSPDSGETLPEAQWPEGARFKESAASEGDAPPADSQRNHFPSLASCRLRHDLPALTQADFFLCANV